MRIEQTYESKNPIKRWYFKKRVDVAIKLADLNKNDLILDFGCGKARYLHKILRNYNLIGYDIHPENSDIDDYRKIKPTKIFVLDVFEHLTKDEIKKTVKNFKKISPNFKLVTTIPTGNWISKTLRVLLGYKPTPVNHKTSFKDVIKILKEELIMKESRSILTVNHISKWEPKQA